MAELARWADLHNLAVTGTRAGRPVALAYYDYVPISIAGEGRYTDLLGLLDRLRSDRTDLGVVSFTIDRRVTGQGVSFTLELAWYVVGADPEAVVEPTAGVSVP